jgi:hypothetical protein
MTEFEYLSVLVSILIGLGIAHLLAGVARMIHRRGEYTLDPVHLLWTGAVFWTLILNWWVFFESRSLEVWSFDYFFVVVVWAVLFFLMAVVLFPPDMAEGEDYAVVFERNRLWFLGLFIASSCVDIVMTAMRGDLFDPPFYLPFAGHFILLGVIAMMTTSRRYQTFLAGYVLAVGLTWSLVVRRFLGG